MDEPLWTCLAFASCAALAALAQNATGFAFTLVLLGLVGLLDLVPLAEAANAACLLTLLQAALHLRLHGLTPQWRFVRPVLWASPVGVAAGVGLLAWLSAHTVLALQAVLGAAIVASAWLLVAATRRRATPSGSVPLALVGVVSGLMGGLFASPGPPLVYQLYRQPLEPAVIRQCLLLSFALNAALRLVFVAAAGTLHAQAFVLAVAAAPAIAAAGLWQRRRAAVDPARLRWVVAALLAAAGLALLAGAIAARAV